MLGGRELARHHGGFVLLLGGVDGGGRATRRRCRCWPLLLLLLLLRLIRAHQRWCVFLLRGHASAVGARARAIAGTRTTPFRGRVLPPPCLFFARLLGSVGLISLGRGKRATCNRRERHPGSVVMCAWLRVPVQECVFSSVGDGGAATGRLRQSDDGRRAANFAHGGGKAFRKNTAYLSLLKKRWGAVGKRGGREEREREGGGGGGREANTEGPAQSQKPALGGPRPLPPPPFFLSVI